MRGGGGSAHAFADSIFGSARPASARLGPARLGAGAHARTGGGISRSENFVARVLTSESPRDLRIPIYNLVSRSASERTIERRERERDAYAVQVRLTLSLSFSLLFYSIFSPFSPFSSLSLSPSHHPSIVLFIFDAPSLSLSLFSLPTLLLVSLFFLSSLRVAFSRSTARAFTSVGSFSKNVIVNCVHERRAFSRSEEIIGVDRLRKERSLIDSEPSTEIVPGEHREGVAFNAKAKADQRPLSRR